MNCQLKKFCLNPLLAGTFDFAVTAVPLIDTAGTTVLLPLAAGFLTGFVRRKGSVA